MGTSGPPLALTALRYKMHRALALLLLGFTLLAVTTARPEPYRHQFEFQDGVVPPYLQNLWASQGMIDGGSSEEDHMEFMNDYF